MCLEFVLPYLASLDLAPTQTFLGVRHAFLPHDFLKVQSAPAQIWKSVVIGLCFFPLKSADVRGPGTRDEPLRTSAWEASETVHFEGSHH